MKKIDIMIKQHETVSATHLLNEADSTLWGQ